MDIKATNLQRNPAEHHGKSSLYSPDGHFEFYSTKTLITFIIRLINLLTPASAVSAKKT